MCRLNRLNTQLSYAAVYFLSNTNKKTRECSALVLSIIAKLCLYGGETFVLGSNIRTRIHVDYSDNKNAQLEFSKYQLFYYCRRN